jgi:proline racemase
MGAQRSSFEKLQRDRAKKEKAALKREKRLDRATEPDGTEIDAPVTSISGDGELSAGDLLALIERIHQEFDDGKMTYEEFEERKTELLGRVSVD